jgi:anti-anti-sigma factor
MAALRVSASAGADGPVVVLSGEADPTTATVLREMLAAQLDTGARLVTVDASGLSFLDSASVRVLVLAARALQGRHGRLVLARPQPIVARLLEITGADRLLDVRELAGPGSALVVPGRSQYGAQGAAADVPEYRIVFGVGQENDREVQGPASGPRPQRVASPATGAAGRLVGRPEAGVAGGREQHPGHRQVAGRVARGDVAEVDHAADLAIVHQDIRRVQVAMQPHRRAIVAGGRQRRVPHAQHRVPLDVILADLAGEQGKVGREGAGALGQRDAAERVGRGVGRGGDVQCAEEPARAGSKELACAAGTPGR